MLEWSTLVYYVIVLGFEGHLIIYQPTIMEYVTKPLYGNDNNNHKVINYQPTIMEYVTKQLYGNDNNKHKGYFTCALSWYI